MLRDLLNLVDAVQVTTVTNSVDGTGNVTESTATSTLPRAAIWQVGSSNNLLSGKIAVNSTHVLALESSERTFVTDDDRVVYNGSTYRVVGRPDDVMQRGELTVVGMELVQ